MTTPTKRFIVLGAGGRTGRLILDSALRAGHHAAAVVRSPERAGLEPRNGLHILAADATDADSLRRVLQPHDIIVSAIGPSGRQSSGLYASVATAVVAATDAPSTHRFIGITSSGVRSDDPNHPWWYRAFMVPFMRPTYGDMRQMESIIATSTIAWTLVRPGRLLDEPASGDYRVENGINPRRGVGIPRGDVADFIVAAAEDTTWLSKYPTITK